MEYLWLFLLFFAALAAGWFYLQRAKARPTTSVTTSESDAAPVAPVASDPVSSDERAAS